MKASLIPGLAATLLLVAPTASFAAGNTLAQSQDGINNDAFLKAMNDAMKDWRQRVETYLAAAKAEGRQASPDLRQIWDEAEAASQKAALATETGGQQAEGAAERELASLKVGRSKGTAPSARNSPPCGPRCRMPRDTGDEPSSRRQQWRRAPRQQPAAAAAEL